MSGLIKKLTTASIVAVGMSLSVPALAHENLDSQIEWIVSIAELRVSKICMTDHNVSDEYAASVMEGFEKQITGYTFSHVKTESYSKLCVTKDPFDYSFTAIYNWMGDLIK